MLEITIPPLGTNLLLRGAVKVAIVIALLIGSRRVYPWAMAALATFVLCQPYELATAPSLGVAALTVLDIFIIWLTWHEWHQDRELRDTWRGTITWVFRHHPPQTANQTRADTDRGCSDE